MEKARPERELSLLLAIVNGGSLCVSESMDRHQSLLLNTDSSTTTKLPLELSCKDLRMSLSCASCSSGGRAASRGRGGALNVSGWSRGWPVIHECRRK